MGKKNSWNFSLEISVKIAFGDRLLMTLEFDFSYIDYIGTNF